MSANPLSYKDLFDFSDDGGIKAALRDIKKLKDVYKDFIDTVVGGQMKSIAEQQVALAESAKQLAAATKDLNITTKEGQKGLIENAKLMAQLDAANKKLNDTKVAAKKIEDSAASSVNALNIKLKEQVAAYNAASAASVQDRAEMDRMAASINRTRAEISQMTAAIKINVTGFNAARGSYAELDAQTKKLVADLKSLEGGLDSNNAAAKKLQSQIADNTKKLKDFDAGMNQNFRNVGNYKSVLDGLKGSVISYVAQFATLYAAIALVKTIVTSNAEISDSIADVRRTAGLTAIEADNLVESLKRIDTRTSLKGLLDISIIGGRLGIAKDNLIGFTAAADKLTLALGSELGNTEQITTGLGKIINIFGADKNITGDALLHVGNAIVDLANKGVASGPYIVDFTQRLAGIAGVAKLSLGATIGLGAGLEELGTSAETGGTAVTQLLFKIGQDVPKYAKLAGKSVEDFGETLKKKPIEALIELAEGLAKNKTGFAEIAESFKDAEAKGVRVAGTLAVIGTNGNFLREKISDANIALGKTNEITDAAILKNDTLGSSIEKLGNEFKNDTTTGAISNFFKIIVDGARSALKEFNELANAQSKQEAFSRFFTGSGKEKYDSLSSINNNFNASEISKTKLNTQNGVVNGTIPGLENKSLPDIKKLVDSYAIATKQAAAALNVYNKEVSKGLISDGDAATTIAKAKDNFTELQFTLKQVSAAYVAARDKVDAANKKSSQVLGASSGVSFDLTSISGLRKEIARLSKLPDSAVDGSDVNKQIDALKLKLHELSGSVKEPKDALEKMQEQLKKLNSELFNGLADGKIDESDKKIQASIEATTKKINDLIALRDKLQRGTPNYGAAQRGDPNNLPTVDFSKDNEKQRKEGNLIDAAGFADQAEKVSLQYAQLNKDLLNQYKDGTITREQYDSQALILANHQNDDRYFNEKNRISSLLKNEQTGSKEYIRLKEQEAAIDTKFAQDQIDNAERTEKARLKAIEVVIGYLRDNIQPLTEQLGQGFGSIFASLTNDLEDFAKNGKLSFADLASTAGGLANGITEIFNAGSQARIDQLTKERDADLASAGNNETAKKAITDRYNKQIATEKTKQAKADKANALFQIAINTAVAVVKALPNIPLSIAIGVLGAIELALVAAKPIPKFKDGRNGGPATLAIVNDGSGPEAIGKNGKYRIAGGGKETVTWLNEGEKVMTAEQTAKAFADEAGPNQFLQSVIAGTGVVQSHEMFNDRLLNAILNSTMTEASMKACFQSAIDSMEVQQLFIDEKGHRTYLKKKNQKVLDQNARHTTGGIG